MDGNYTDRQAVIDLDRLSRNLKIVKELVGPRTKIMAVVKAEAYGHGLIPVSRRLVAEGAAALGVGRIEEVESLRRADLGVPVVILTGILPQEAEQAVRLRSLPCIFDMATAEALAAVGRSRGRNAEALVKVDTGMGRLGFALDEVGSLIDRLAAIDGLTVRGIVSHLATAPEADQTFALSQIERFNDVVARFKDRGFELDLNSLSNSAGVLNLPLGSQDIVRPGIMLYGCRPDLDTEAGPALHPVMTLKTRLIQVREHEAGVGLSYGLTYVTTCRCRIGTVALGYGHGLSRSLSNQGAMLVRGQRAPIVGRVSMNLTLLDLTGIPEAEEGDEVVALGSQGDEVIRAEELAGLTGTIGYELLCLLGGLNPRVYSEQE